MKQQLTRKEELPTSEHTLVKFNFGNSAPLYFGFNMKVSKLLVESPVSYLLYSQ